MQLTFIENTIPSKYQEKNTIRNHRAKRKTVLYSPYFSYPNRWTL